ncbi:Vitamin B12 import ATP-binding protein BtuD [Streptomyces sp. RB17]|uniref:dipeptide/oligopeptide/nickel ABC transporter permease/ATP-binding protein n=1 Tax=Streptomyces sp. RB17 TaxID=2585197 RepID=UPI001296045E|nr:dipeptide/oligopeptide/nickel ABC transporter permease/ATP-binding protein [Streptomyces sp. RB17]MQY34711.1 Vitamin B12 import ATP-binding protein BtuD [Streptomyces sp. RB17]
MTEPPSTERRRRPAPVLRTVLRRPAALVCLTYLALLVLASLTAPWLAPHGPTATDLDHVLTGPSTQHPLGTDNLGRDVLSRLMYGGRPSLTDAAVATSTVLVVGAGCGVTAGFLGGWFDRVFCWAVDLMLAIPVLVTLLVVLAVVGDHQVLAMTVLGVLVAPGVARVVRGATLAVREELYVAAARVSGLARRHVLVRHVLPRVAGPVVIQVSLFAGGALMIDAGLSYLGFGADPPTPTWGNMIADAAAVTDRQPWLLAPPGVVLGLAILACGVLGDAVRDAGAGRSTPAASRSRPSRNPESRPGGNASHTPVPGSGTDSSPALLSIRDATIALPGPHGMTNVVEDLDLDIGRGETVGLVGESGCGKSITGRAVLGLLPGRGECTAGSIVFDGIELVGADPRTVRALRGRRIALVSQTPLTSLDPVIPVGRQIAELVRRHHGGTRRAARARAVELLRAVRVAEPEQVATRHVHELSGGMAQRVAIALALAGEPDLLIADEPTTALDASVRAEVLDLLRQVQRERALAVLLISHDWKVVSRMCRRTYVMYAGQVVESGRTADLLARPLHPYTAGLLASAPGRAAPREPLRAIPGTVPAPHEWPQGCHFAARCALATPACAAATVALLEPAPDRGTRCLRHTELGEGDDRDRATAVPS